MKLENKKAGALAFVEFGLFGFESVLGVETGLACCFNALKGEQTKLDKGKSTSFIVLQLQRELTTARSAEIRALADYNIALADLAYNEGSTLERRNVDLKVK